MTGAKYSLLTRVADCIERAGVSSIALGDLRLLAGVEAFFDGETTPNAGEAKMVAMLALAVDAREENFQAIRQEFGDEMADHVKSLAVPYNAQWENRLSLLLRRLRDENPMVRLAAAALLNGEFHYHFHGKKPENRGRIKLLLDAIPQSGDSASTKLKMLWDAMVQANRDGTFSTDTSESDTESLWFISISFDLGGSTAAKTALTRVAGADAARLQELNAQFYKKFMNIEHRFYRDIFRKDDREPDPLDFSKLFLIKGVGDELWMVYPIPGNDVEQLNHAMSRILPAALQAAYASVEFLATEKRDNPNFDPRQEEKDLGQHEWVRSPVKVFIDLVDDAYEIAGPRGEFFLARVPEYYDPNSARKFFRKIDARHAEVSSRLNLGFAEIGLRTYRVARRSDYIGHKIDLFFRASKGAKPGLVTMGQSIYSKLNVTQEDPIKVSGVQFTKIAHCFRLHPESPSAQKLKRYWLRERTIPKKGLEGIGYDYRLFHLFDHFNLLQVFKNWDLTRDLRQDGEKDPYSKTRDLISLEGIEAICERERGKGGKRKGRLASTQEIWNKIKSILNSLGFTLW